ncbi:MAG: radical SAM protein [Elusimicrobia bacterium]|nr:radical SAM protein [Elusimicrobiota bacterium]
MIDRMDLKVGFQCNNRCLFCVQGDKRLRHPSRKIEDLILKLEEGMQQGIRSLVVTGGEPTLHPLVLEVVSKARALGFTTVQIQTNGRLFAYEAACRRFIQAGATEFSPSLHGSSPQMHDFLTQVPGSFLQTMAGIRNLKQLGQQVLTNTVITQHNYHDLPDIARLLTGLQIDQMQFAFVHILGEAEKNSFWLIPSKSLLQPYLLKALAQGRKAGVRVMTEAIPPCLLPGFEDCAAEWIMPSTLVYDAEATIDYLRYRKTDGKGLGPRCQECVWACRCEGPWKEYPSHFGWEDFRPILKPIEK